ncbi:hypothetical protein WA158_000048 [Blastocystis sp. Blastoise]
MMIIPLYIDCTEYYNSFQDTSFYFMNEENDLPTILYMRQNIYALVGTEDKLAYYVEYVYTIKCAKPQVGNGILFNITSIYYGNVVMINQQFTDTYQAVFNPPLEEGKKVSLLKDNQKIIKGKDDLFAGYANKMKTLAMCGNSKLLSSSSLTLYICANVYLLTKNTNSCPILDDPNSIFNSMIYYNNAYYDYSFSLGSLPLWIWIPIGESHYPSITYVFTDI